MTIKQSIRRLRKIYMIIIENDLIDNESTMNRK